MVAAPPALAENGSLLFDGVDDYVSVPDPVDLQGPLTLEAWVKVADDPAGGRIISNRNGLNGYEMDVVKSDDDFRFRLTFNASVVTSAIFTGHQGTWTHVAATWAGTSERTVRLYINGTEVATADPQGGIQTALGQLHIGSMGSGAYNSSHQIDEVRIWSGALDGATIAAWMSRPVAADHPNYADLEGYWDFDEVSGQTVHNLAGDARRDGVLGSGSEEDTHDPLWQREGAPVPIYPATIGQIKQRFLKQ
jgi:hypothetical protein